VNLYVHFPFCRSKCAYCALHSYVGRTEEDRRAYTDRLAGEIGSFFAAAGDKRLSALYFGGGTPALCDLSGIFEVVGRTEKSPDFEFTVELNPLDATPALLEQLKRGGVNRISMGVQSFDDVTLKAMGRLHDARQAREAWKMIRDAGFGNAGIDLICGWPGDGWERTLESAAALEPDHCSVYTLILEPGTRLAHDVDAGRVTLPSDDEALAELAAAERALATVGLERYEISSFAKPGKECRHNLATWRGEDYTGIGEGACSREGNAVSRVIFRLRLLKEGFSPSAAASDYPELAPRVEEWTETLDRFAAEGLLSIKRSADGPPAYILTPRGTEVCDTILAELV
jgi:oxygen-independent coproporphyrinogen-3 oxidase